MLRRTLKLQGCLAILALGTWTLGPQAAIVAPPSVGRSLDAPDYFELAAAVGKDVLDAALITAPSALIVPPPTFQPLEAQAAVLWHGIDRGLADIRSPPTD